jgi:solute carrier family 10 (sodium/bile acid cotransporter), member 7
LLDVQNIEISASGIGRIFALLFLPFAIGHMLRPWLLPWLERWPALTTIVDRGTILLAVYGAFSAAVVDRVFDRVPGGQVFALIAFCLVLLALILGSSWAAGKALGFDRGSRLAILFCGSVKSIASGAPMAKVMFPGSSLALVLAPVMLYHTLQLLVCASIAGAIMRRREISSLAPGRSRRDGTSICR